MLHKKKRNYICAGMIGIILFGLILPQPVQALLVLVNSPIRTFFTSHLFCLCIIVGMVQGICEECGYFGIFKKFYSQEKDAMCAVWFGIGRSGIEFIYNLCMIIASGAYGLAALLNLVARVVAFGGTTGLSVLDFVSSREKKAKNRLLLLISIMMHAILNGTLYAAEKELIPMTASGQSVFMILFSILVIGFAGVVYKKYKICKQ